MVFQCLQQDRGERVLLIQRRTRCERTELKDFRRSLRDGRAGCGNRRAGEQLDKFASSHSHRLRKPRAMHCNKPQRYSITSAARPSSEGGTVKPSAVAVFRLMTSSIFVGCSTGNSAGLAPFKILSTEIAERR